MELLYSSLSFFLIAAGVMLVASVPLLFAIAKRQLEEAIKLEILSKIMIQEYNRPRVAAVPPPPPPPRHIKKKPNLYTVK